MSENQIERFQTAKRKQILTGKRLRQRSKISDMKDHLLWNHLCLQVQLVQRVFLCGERLKTVQILMGLWQMRQQGLNSLRVCSFR